MNKEYFDSTKYFVKEIDKRLAQDVVIRYHYMHRKAPCSYAFGMIRKSDNKLCGVIMYGSPATPMICKGVCGIEERDHVIELTRLCINDNVGINGESWLVSKSLELLRRIGCKKDIVVSYADSGVNHVGYIYQASNFIYTGLSAKHKDYRSKNKDIGHQRHFYDGKNAKDLKNDDTLEYVERSRKHRYVYFNCSKGRRRYLIKKLKYKIEKYPKGG